MANRAANFAYRMTQIWEKRSEDAVAVAERQGATIMYPVNSNDHWINEPGDEPGYLMVWPDGSMYIVGQNGNWITSPRRPGRNHDATYVPI
jgi:hypothetical protein